MLMVGSAGAQAPAPGAGIFVVDAGNNRIVRMDDMAGAGWTTLGSGGSGVNQFVSPAGIAVDRAGRIYVVDTGNHRICGSWWTH